MNEELQRTFDELMAYVQEGRDEDYVTAEMEATGPFGHLYVAVSNLLDYASSELTTDDQVESAIKLAKQITELT